MRSAWCFRVEPMLAANPIEQYEDGIEGWQKARIQWLADKCEELSRQAIDPLPAEAGGPIPVSDYLGRDVVVH